MITKAAIERFERFTRFELNQFLSDFTYFMNNYYNEIVLYYSGKVNQTNSNAFSLLNDLIIRGNQVTDQFTLNANTFSSTEDWELLLLIEELKVKFLTIYNSDKWLRSTKSNDAYYGAVEYNQILRSNQTLEEIAFNTKGNPEQWVNIARRNDLEEIDYSTNGGNSIVLQGNKNAGEGVFINVVVDNMVGEKLYGLDFDRYLSYENDDLKVLSHKKTAIQSIEILIKLKKGDVPEFPSFGVDAALAVGSDIGGVLFPSITRQLSDLFRSDDSLIDFNVRSFKYENASLYLTYSVSTRYNFVYNSQTNV